MFYGHKFTQAMFKWSVQNLSEVRIQSPNWKFRQKSHQRRTIGQSDDGRIMSLNVSFWDLFTFTCSNVEVRGGPLKIPGGGRGISRAWFFFQSKLAEGIFFSAIRPYRSSVPHNILKHGEKLISESKNCANSLVQYKCTYSETISDRSHAHWFVEYITKG